MPTPEDRLKPPPTNQRMGLGDAVHMAAKPVVMLVSVFGGPDLNRCRGCIKRREAWNKAMPNVMHPFKRQ
jgi:hypothetical protein